MSLLTATQIFTSCESKNSKGGEEAKSFKFQFPFPAGFFYNQYIEQNKERFERKFLKATFNGKEYDLMFQVDDCDSEGFLKRVSCFIGNLDENGIWITHWDGVPVRYKEFVSEFQSKYEFLSPESQIGQISRQIVDKDLELHKAKRKYIDGYEGSEEMVSDMQMLFFQAGKAYFKSSDGNLLIEVTFDVKESDMNQWKVSGIYYQYVDDWLIEQKKSLERIDREISRTINNKQGF